jgi:hypothetical protein
MLSFYLIGEGMKDAFDHSDEQGLI